ncbi:MAG: hypothetical protein U1E31_01230 [Rickettsiales bacterium]
MKSNKKKLESKIEEVKFLKFHQNSLFIDLLAYSIHFALDNAINLLIKENEISENDYEKINNFLSFKKNLLRNYNKYYKLYSLENLIEIHKYTKVYFKCTIIQNLKFIVY